MGRSKNSIENRKLQKKKKQNTRKKQLPSLLKIAHEKTREIEINFYNYKLKVINIEVTSVTKRIADNNLKKCQKFLPNHSVLSDEVIEKSDIVVGEGTFGKVWKGTYTSLGVPCAIKQGKHGNFNGVYECKVLQKLQSSKYFPRIFGMLGKEVVMELVSSNDIVKTISSELRNLDVFEKDIWIRICYQLASAVKFMHINALLHNDLKSNNVLLKGIHLTPILIDMGKVTSRYSPEVYKLSEKQRGRYNKNHPYLAHELRNTHGSKQSSATDVYSLGYIFKAISNSGNNQFLKGLSAKMLDNSPGKRLNLFQVISAFGHKYV